MEIQNYDQLKRAIDLLFDGGGSKELMGDIRRAINSIEGARNRLVLECLGKCGTRPAEHEYIMLFEVDDQVEIIMNVVKENQEQNVWRIYNLAWLIVQAEEEAMDKVLDGMDELTIYLLMSEIKENINKVGHRIIDRIEKSTRFDIMWERKQWRKLYRKCKRALKDK